MENPYASLYGMRDQQRSCAAPAGMPSNTEQAHPPWQQQRMDSFTGHVTAAQPAARPTADNTGTGSQHTPWHDPSARLADPVGASMAQQPAEGEPSRKRRRCEEEQTTSAHAAQPPDTVLVWDLDETLILFQSLQDGRFSAAFGLQARTL